MRVLEHVDVVSTAMSDRKAEIGLQRRRTVTQALVTFLVLLCLVLLIPDFWGPAINYQATLLFGPRSADELLQRMTERENSMELSQDTILFPILVLRGRDTANRAQLEAKAGQDDLEGDYANLALFKLRDNPRTRLSTVMDRFERRPLTDLSVIDCVLMGYLDPDAERPYTDIIITALDKAPEIQKQEVLLMSLARFASDPLVLSKITEKIKAQDVEVRVTAAQVLGLAAQRDPHAKQLPEIIEPLYAALDDPATDYRVRDTALYALAQHGWTKRFEGRLLQIFRHGSYSQRNICIGAAGQLPEHGKAMKILFTMLVARNPVNLFEVILAIGIGIILWFWWVLLLLILVAIAARSAIPRIKARRSRNEHKGEHRLIDERPA